jgi:hypothetical protein
LVRGGRAVSCSLIPFACPLRSLPFGGRGGAGNSTWISFRSALATFIPPSHSSYSLRYLALLSFAVLSQLLLRCSPCTQISVLSFYSILIHRDIGTAREVLNPDVSMSGTVVDSILKTILKPISRLVSRNSVPARRQQYS